MDEAVKKLIVAALLEGGDVVSLTESKGIVDYHEGAECYRRAAEAVLARLAANNFKVIRDQV